MAGRVVLDLSPTEREAFDNIMQRLARLSTKLDVVAGKDAGLTSGDLFITQSDDHAMAAAQAGATVWRVAPGTGELESWKDVPLALAFANGTIDELSLILTDRTELQGQTISSLSWTPQGDAAGRTNQGTPIFATAGPDGETPQVFLGPEAQAREREANAFAQTLSANQQVSSSDELGPGQTHSLSTSKGHRPILKRNRFSQF